MILKTSILYALISFTAIAATLCLRPLIVEAEESQNIPVATVAVSHLLDGKSFKGPTGEKGKKTHHEDVLVFKDGQFTSSMCFEYGFTGGPYTARAEGNLIHFEAETISPTHGKMNWKGTLQSDTMVVDYSWTKKRLLWTTYREYWFKGTLQK
ncbi:MAG: hypothetical protein ACR2PH_10735 [Desulfobulbia bacterium]